jgi:hypothetical protein
MFSMAYLFFGSLVILGGAISCLLMALRHLLLSKGKAAKEEFTEADPV